MKVFFRDHRDDEELNTPGFKLFVNGIDQVILENAGEDSEELAQREQLFCQYLTTEDTAILNTFNPTAKASLMRKAQILKEADIPVHMEQTGVPIPDKHFVHVLIDEFMRSPTPQIYEAYVLEIKRINQRVFQRDKFLAEQAQRLSGTVGIIVGAGHWSILYRFARNIPVQAIFPHSDYPVSFVTQEMIHVATNKHTPEDILRSRVELTLDRILKEESDLPRHQASLVSHALTSVYGIELAIQSGIKSKEENSNLEANVFEQFSQLIPIIPQICVDIDSKTGYYNSITFAREYEFYRGVNF